MNNNQFKKVIRTKIEEEANGRQLICYYVDINNNTRIIYVYNKDFKIKGTINCYLNDRDCSIEYSLNKQKLVSICNYEMKFSGTYLELDKIFNSIETMIQAIERN